MADTADEGIPFPEKTGDPVGLDADQEPADTAEPQDDSSDESEDKLISQKELDRVLQKRLKRQEDQFKKQYADYEQLKADAEAFRSLQDEKATDAERWEKERSQLLSTLQEREERLTKLERANLIADLATEKGLPKSFWKRVQGETEEELAEDIESIINDLPSNLGVKGNGKATPGARKGSVYGGGGEGEAPEPDTDELVSRIPRGPQLRIDKPRSYK